MPANVELHVEGMTCGHCKASVEKSLNALAGVTGVNVKLEAKKVEVTYENNKTDLTAIKEAIEKEGYTVVE